MTYRPLEKDGSSAYPIMNGPLHSRKRSKADRPPQIMSDARPPKVPLTANQKAKSVPNTPLHRGQSPMEGRTSPSATRPTRDNSPRSVHSASSQNPSAYRKVAGGCKYETGMAQARRRVPYSLGPEKLEAAAEEASKQLGVNEEKQLSEDIYNVFQRLVPTEESEKKRENFVRKLERLLREKWPSNSISVNVFGSTGNRLGTDDSDVDICITTDCKELERVCSIADLLAKNGMERVVCVSSARVPIVKVWDPELEVACDMNVNNPIALENTALIRTYTWIDERFRPLAMIVKHWAKRRMLNDAALGGTLSSYTWICLVLNFLQTREPAILPTLQKDAENSPHYIAKVNVAFDKATESYRDFGQQNKSTLGELLYQFFHFYGHELDFETSVMSVRQGKVISKAEKGWHRLQDNRLCVEEPFNVVRNLANTADDTSMRGIHQELRRAFLLVASGQLEKCCEQYIPSENEFPIKRSETFIQPQTRTIIPQAPPQSLNRNNRQGYKSNRNTNRNSGGGRRASNPSGRASTYLRDLPFAMTPQELQLQAQHQQHLLHDQLFQQYQYLQQQEQELRMQLYQQNLRQRGIMLANGYASSSVAGTDSPDDGQEVMFQGRSPSSTRIAMSAPLYQQRFGTISPYQSTAVPSGGIVTNPGSPSLSNVVPDSRRYTRSVSVNQNHTGSLRAHSQPARSVPVALAYTHTRQNIDMPYNQNLMMGGRRSSVISNPNDLATGYLPHHFSMPGGLYDAGRRPVEYVGYYVGQSPSLGPYTRSTTISPVPSHTGLAIHHGGLSPRLSTRSSQINSGTTSPSPQPASLDGSITTPATESTPVTTSFNQARQSSPPRSGPLVVDGSVYSPNRRQPISRVTSDLIDGLTLSASTSEDPGFDTPSSSDDFQQDKASPLNGLSEAERRFAQMQAIRNQLYVSSKEAGVSDLRQYKAASTTTTTTTENLCVERNSHGGHEPNGASVLSQHLSNMSINGGLRPDHELGGESDVLMGRAEQSLHSTPLATRPNGIEATASLLSSIAPNQFSNGWQTQSKKKKKGKKGGKVDGEALINSAGGDVLPEDLSLRKGG